MLLLLLFAVFALSTAQISGPCKADLSEILDELVQVANEIVQAQTDCSSPNASSTCVNDIDIIITSFGNLTVDLTQTAHDCFGASGNGTLCAQLIARVVADLEVTTGDAEKAVHDCVQPKSNACVLDLSDVSSDAAKAVMDMSSAIAICAGAQPSHEIQLAKKRLLRQ